MTLHQLPIPTSARGAQQLVQQQTGVRVPLSQREAEKMVRQRVEREVSQQTRQLRRQGERIARKEAGKLAKRIGATEAAQVAQKTFREMGIPSDIPFQPPTEMSARGVRDAAFATGSVYLEKAIQKKTGLPIPVPRKPTLKELERTITGIIPSDAGEALELGVSIGIQYASGALASLIAGATIGSAIPGLGTVIGIGMALGVEALKAAFKEPPAVPQCRTQVRCPPFPAMSPIELIPWLAEKVAPIDTLLAREGVCVGPAQVCRSRMMTVSADAYRISQKTPQTLGYYQLLRLLPKYKAAVMMRPSRAVQDAKLLLPKLVKRQQQLTALMQKVARIERMSARDIASLRFAVVTEMRTAGTAFAMDPNADTKQWLATLGKTIRRIEAREAALLQERRVRQQQQQQRFEQARKDPAKMRAHQLQQLRFQCSEGNQAACAQARRLAAGQPTGRVQSPRPAPVRPTPAPRPAPKPKVDPNLFKRCYAIVTDLVRKNPRASKCLTRSDLDRLARICVLAYQPRPQLTPQQALLRMMQYADAVCKRKGM